MRCARVWTYFRGVVLMRSGEWQRRAASTGTTAPARSLTTTATLSRDLDGSHTLRGGKSHGECDGHRAQEEIGRSIGKPQSPARGDGALSGAIGCAGGVDDPPGAVPSAVRARLESRLPAQDV